ncbi:bifunctional riboflavin kinase/FAD synthetase [Oceanobacter mangrovi]|uniref:bifunctional riboflavin kinase/FAD synthetase n=1 Tax=Oceanobacter mangrovi TaxID=2862510 RepID=UPI001C8EE4F2|nr:bifunctional riboflavin kinase/FAD synthetase [Oceanobacter mangrovi]
MRLLRGLHNIPDDFPGCAATIGNFDGLHLGHQAILQALHRVADSHQLPTLVMIFEPQPKEFFAIDKAPARLANLREKLIDLDADHVDYVLCLPFNQALRSMSAADFIQQVLVQTLGVRHLIVGDDFRFGCDRSGDYQALAAAGQQFGFDVEDSSTYLVAGQRVSSTRVRSELQANNLAEVEKLLGHKYRMSGRVGYGRQLGRTIDTPTANVMLKRHLLPLQGVFAVEVLDENTGQRFEGVANVGNKPSITEVPEPSLEVHLFDFTGNLYGHHLTVTFCHKIRDEKKFNGLDELKQAIACDKNTARRYFADLPNSLRSAAAVTSSEEQLDGTD